MTLQEFFTQNPKVAIAFSGGVDSSYLLYAALQHARQVKAYYVKSAFQPRHEFDDAQRLVRELGADLRVLYLDILAHESVTSNPADRCYYCKQQIFTAIIAAAKEDGFSLLCDGSNASDNPADRPGMKALQELSVASPLQLCGLHKSEIRKLSEQAGLFTWDKPAYACLATRIQTLQRIDAPTLTAVESCEDFLFALGLRDFRVRVSGNTARLELRMEDMPALLQHRSDILSHFKQFFERIVLDLETR